MKKIYLLLLISLCLNAQDALALKQQNALYIQNLIEIEEKIAENFEKYLLTEFKIPTLTDLKTNDYLGTNFSVSNKMGEDIAFKSTSELKIKYAVTKDEYIKENVEDIDNYIVQLYNRDLHRNRTSIYYEKDSLSSSYSLIKLQSSEAENIFEILNSGKTIAKTCVVETGEPSLTDTYCNNNEKSIRWYNSSSSWIEYSKKNFTSGNVTIKSSALLGDSKLEELPIGTYIFVQNGSKYVNIVDTSSTTPKILKVD
jgi:hypothetical protein